MKFWNWLAQSFAPDASPMQQTKAFLVVIVPFTFIFSSGSIYVYQLLQGPLAPTSVQDGVQSPLFILIFNMVMAYLILKTLFMMLRWSLTRFPDEEAVPDEFSFQQY